MVDDAIIGNTLKRSPTSAKIMMRQGFPVFSISVPWVWLGSFLLPGELGEFFEDGFGHGAGPAFTTRPSWRT